MKVRFPDGTVVTASALPERLADNPGRDFGLYLDAAWRPTWDAETIDWPDFGVPANPPTAVKAIVAAFDRARRGDRVEIGCLGGRGRTGTVLACMAVLAGIPVDSAVTWVRDSYDARAVETTEQQDWVRWFASQVKIPEGSK